MYIEVDVIGTVSILLIVLLLVWWEIFLRHRLGGDTMLPHIRDTRAEREEVERRAMLLREKIEKLSKDTKKD